MELGTLEPDFVEYKCATSGSGESRGTSKTSATCRSSLWGTPVTMYASRPDEVNEQMLHQVFNKQHDMVFRRVNDQQDTTHPLGHDL